VSRAPLALARVLRRVLFAVFVGVSLAHASHAAPAPENLLNKKAPAFTLTDLSGQSLTLARFRGKVVLLNFWATWCASCQVEMPVFAAWQQQYGPQGFEIIGISMDDGAGPARRLVARLKLNYPVAMGDERLGAHYGGVLGLPLTFLIDRNGVVRARFQGETDLKLIERQVAALLAQPGGTGNAHKQLRHNKEK
jgi:peroxiredoxin